MNLRCTSSETATEPADAPASPTGPAYTLLVQTADTLHLHHLHNDTRRVLQTGVSSINQQAAAPNHDAVAFTYATPDSVHLARYTLGDDRLKQVDARARPVSYSIAWHPERDAFAYGFYTPTDEGNRGPGAIRVAENGSTRSVGCSASTEVLAWLLDDQLAVRNDDNLYLVAAVDCATEASLDIRRHHHMTYDASHTRMAYIYRTLEYNREADAYQPDSTLYMSDVAGNEETRLFGNDRAPRHATWSPDSPELAVSVLEDGRRRLVVYNAESDETTFLIPPESAPEGAQQHPQWSPTGDAVAFTLAADGRLQAAVRQAGSTDLLQPATGPVWGWVDAKTLILPTRDGLALVNQTGSLIHTLPAGATLVSAWPTDAAPQNE